MTETGQIPKPGEPNWFGYTPDPVFTEALAQSIPTVYGDQLDNLPRDMDKSALIYRHLVRCLKGSKWVDFSGRLLNQNQGRHGSCVGHGTSVGGDTTAACDIVMRREPEVWPLHPRTRTPVRSAPDWLYGASRHVSGTLARWQGSFGSAAAQLLRDWGTVYQMPYGDVDLTEYSAERCDVWDTYGVPQSTVKEANFHRFQTTIRIRSVEQAVGLVQNGYGWNMCCSLGWSDLRDEDGFSSVVTSWAHSQGVSGYVSIMRRDRSPRARKRGFVTLNSWPKNWNSGPLGSETPDLPWCSYIAYLEDVERAIHQGDCWSYGGYQGFAASPFDWSTFG